MSRRQDRSPLFDGDVLFFGILLIIAYFIITS